MAVNVTANWQLIRTMDPLLQALGRRPRGVRHLRRRLSGPRLFGAYAASKAALERWCAPMPPRCANTNVRANLFAPGPTRTRMYAAAFPGVDPETLPTPEEVAKAIVPLCLPACSESGKVYGIFAQRPVLCRSARRTDRYSLPACGALNAFASPGL